MLWILIQAVPLANLNPRAWLSAYLVARGGGGGKAPSNAEQFLPWRMSEPRKVEWGFGRAESDVPDSS